MITMTTNQDYFNELREQIFNEECWNSQVFATFNHEASSGKSRFVHELLAQVATTPPYHRALYVQLFAGDELKNAVHSINQHAGKNVAADYISGDNKRSTRFKQAKDATILCVTHEMYFQFAKGKYPELWTEREILIIDEYPNFMHPLTIGGDEFGQFVLNAMRYPKFGLRHLAEKLMQKFVELERVYKNTENNIPFIQFPEFNQALPSLEAFVNSTDIKADKDLIENIHHMVKNGAYFHETKFHTYDFRFSPLLLKNNIVLDANAGFDYRYALSDFFQVKKQDKLFDYASSTLTHYSVDTGKGALATYANFTAEVLNEISLAGSQGALFVTDMQNEAEVEKSIIEHFKEYGGTVEAISENMGCNIAVDHFGNLTGVNTYREMDTIVILKTPNFNYTTYLLNHFYYTQKGKDSRLFENHEVELVRRNMIGGEMYQTIHRISRNHDRPARMYVFCSNQEAVDIVVKELPGVQYVKNEMTVTLKKRRGNAKTSGKSRVTQPVQYQQLLLECKRAGKETVSKQEVMHTLGIKDLSNLNKLTRQSKSFLQENGIAVEHHDFRLIPMAKVG